MNYQQTSSTYPCFRYQSYRIARVDGGVQLAFLFSIDGLSEFKPTWFIPVQKNTVDLESPAFHHLVFSLGMVELISYWKITCSPSVRIEAGSLSQEQVCWWKKLYYKGLGEFFYINGIHVDPDHFMDLQSSGPVLPAVEASRGGDGYLIPVGGGKDSAVTLELLQHEKMHSSCYFINERHSSRRCCEVAGYASEQILCATRTLDPRMLELNRQGFLNGHTPFSAVAAFSGVLTAYLNEKRRVVLSNEASASDPTLIDSEINHQYSKSFEFERDFRQYLNDYIPCGVTYFSLLRPLSELQIAAVFSRLPQYHHIFRSCNLGSKQDMWCGDCPKCLFVCLLLTPFLSPEALVAVFGGDLLENTALQNTLEKLTGIQPNKPFECVGSREELNTAICLGIRRWEAGGTPLPFLLQVYKESDQYKIWSRRPNEYRHYFHTEHFLPPELETIVRTYAERCWQ